jgi:pimeloyl-ACP methyl ester carboxylesterase
MLNRRRSAVLVVLVLVVGVLGYSGYVGYEVSRQLVDAPATGDCRTPDVQFGWTYEAINYDIGDDVHLPIRNVDLTACTYQGVKAGNDVVTDDGVRIGGWYIPAANGAGPSAPTVVLVHGFQANKSGVLVYGEGLHDSFNLVAFDMRNVGRSTGTQTTAGVLEQQDLRSVIDWLEATKHPTRIGVLGNSLGAATGLAESLRDPRVEALALDSLHTRLRYQLEARLQENGHPAYPGTWASFVGAWLRTGVDIGSVDAEDEIAAMRTIPVLLTHGTADAQDLPSRTQAFYESLLDRGIPTELHWCEGSGHTAPAGMPVEVCRDAFGGWVRDFFTTALSRAG